MKKLLLLALAAVMMACCVESSASRYTTNNSGIVEMYGCEYIKCPIYCSGMFYPVYIHKGNCHFCKERRQKEIKELVELLKEK